MVLSSDRRGESRVETPVVLEGRETLGWVWEMEWRSESGVGVGRGGTEVGREGPGNEVVDRTKKGGEKRGKGP